jgi:uncharacterized membrane protein
MMRGARARLMRSRTVATTAVFTAFVTVTTMAFTLTIPATPSGYFNLGEVMVYICALLTGPYVGAFAGGVGSSIADVLLGSPAYAPGTLVIKAGEGFVVGYLSSRVGIAISKRMWRATTVTIGAFVGVLLVVLGSVYFTGYYNFTLGFPIGPQWVVAFTLPELFWIVLGVLTFAIVAAAGFLVNEKIGWTVFSVLVGGTLVYFGYFVYNYAVLQIGLGGSAGEFPYDVGQALIGLIIAVPVVSRVKKMWVRSPRGLTPEGITAN